MSRYRSCLIRSMGACRLVNKSGLRLTYWSASDSGQGSAYALNAWEESPLMVEPVQKPVILTDTQQHVRARCLISQCCMYNDTCLAGSSVPKHWGSPLSTGKGPGTFQDLD